MVGMGDLLCRNNLCGLSFSEFRTIGDIMNEKKLVFVVAAGGTVFLAFMGIAFEQYWLCASPILLLLLFWAMK